MINIKIVHNQLQKNKTAFKHGEALSFDNFVTSAI